MTLTWREKEKRRIESSERRAQEKERKRAEVQARVDAASYEDWDALHEWVAETSDTEALRKAVQVLLGYPECYPDVEEDGGGNITGRVICERHHKEWPCVAREIEVAIGLTRDLRYLADEAIK